MQGIVLQGVRAGCRPDLRALRVLAAACSEGGFTAQAQEFNMQAAAIVKRQEAEQRREQGLPERGVYHSGQGH